MLRALLRTAFRPMRGREQELREGGAERGWLEHFDAAVRGQRPRGGSRVVVVDDRAVDGVGGKPAVDLGRGPRGSDNHDRPVVLRTDREGRVIAMVETIP